MPTVAVVAVRLSGCSELRPSMSRPLVWRGPQTMEHRRAKGPPTRRLRAVMSGGGLDVSTRHSFIAFVKKRSSHFINDRRSIQKSCSSFPCGTQLRCGDQNLFGLGIECNATAGQDQIRCFKKFFSNGKIGNCSRLSQLLCSPCFTLWAMESTV
jgi:hypothetical protein